MEGTRGKASGEAVGLQVRLPFVPSPPVRCQLRPGDERRPPPPLSSTQPGTLVLI